MSNKRLIWFGVSLIFCALVVFGGWRIFSYLLQRGEGGIPSSDVYTTTVQARAVRDVADDLGMITRIKVTPDDQQMFVTTLSGTVWVFTNQEGKFVKQATPLYQMQLGWTPGAENGLTGLIVSADFMSTREIFLLYAKSLGGGVGENQILRLKVERQNDVYVAVEPKVIFTANTKASGAHQIQGGFATRIEGKPHLVFAIGENYRPPDAKDLSKEAGKIMVLQEDGSNPLGARPYPQYPRIQVIGIRNVYDLALDPRSGWVFWTENGPDINDRIVYAPIFDADIQFDGNWDNRGESLATVLANGQSAPQYVIYKWSETVAPTDIITDQIGRFYVNIFSSAKNPTKEILMGEKIGDVWKVSSIVTRKPEATGGNLLGLSMTNKGDFYFGDFSDGKLYVMTRAWNR